MKAFLVILHLCSDAISNLHKTGLNGFEKIADNFFSDLAPFKLYVSAKKLKCSRNAHGTEFSDTWPRTIRSHVTRLKQWIYTYGKFVVHYMCSCSKKSFQVFISYAGDNVLS